MTPARRGPVLVAALAALACAATVLAGCTSGNGARSDSASPGSTVPSTAAPPSTDTPTPPSTASSTPPSSTPPATTSVAPPATKQTSPAPRSTCTKVTVRVIRGSAARGREFAALQFTNAGTKRCTLVGYPVVMLLRNGTPIGTASQPASTRQSSRVLVPGDTAESKLNDYSTCNAPLSDQLRVTVPGSAQRAVRPAQLRACVLRVSQLAAPE